MNRDRAGPLQGFVIRAHSMGGVRRSSYLLPKAVARVMHETIFDLNR